MINKSRIVALALSIIPLSSFAIENDCKYEEVLGSGIGDVKYSLLSLNKFREVNGKEWVLLRGQSRSHDDLKVSNPESSFYKYGKKTIFDYFTLDANISVTILPNAGGKFLRVANNKYEVGEKATRMNPQIKKIGEYQEDVFKMHTHNYTRRKKGNHNDFLAGSKNEYGLGTYNDALDDFAVAYTGNKNETRPKNITVNAFVKVRLKCVKNLKRIDVLEAENIILKKRLDNQLGYIMRLCKAMGLDCINMKK